MLGGMHVHKWKCFPGLRIKYLCKTVTIPPLIFPFIILHFLTKLISKIVMGCLARNLFGISTAGYQDKWASYIRQICLSLLLIRGALILKFKG